DGEAELEKEPGAVAGNSSLVEVVSDAAEGDLAAFGDEGRLLLACSGESSRAEGGDTAETAAAHPHAYQPNLRSRFDLLAQEVLFILACIVVCLVCLFVGGLLAMETAAVLSDKNIVYEALILYCVLGGLVFCGAFAMAWPVGVAVLVSVILVGVVAKITKLLVHCAGVAR
ncbi:unnamed protein product, partial [Effrenium voratum]